MIAGRAVALAFGREGAKVVISYYNEDLDAKTVLYAIQQSGSDGMIIPGDISNETHVQYIIEQTVLNYGRIGINAKKEK